MKKRMIFPVLLLLMAFSFSGCGLLSGVISMIAPEGTESTGLPLRMVERIDVILTPQEDNFERHYETQENLNLILQMLRDLATRDIPEEAPALSSDYSYYTITATYASGEQQVYRLLSGQYLKMGEEDWCHISPELAAKFAEFLHSHPSDDGSYIPPETDPVEETTAPTESNT